MLKISYISNSFINYYLLTGVVLDVSLQIERALSGDDSSEFGF